MISNADKESFNSEVLPCDFLFSCILWIGSQLDPEDVFERHVLERWAHDNGYGVLE